jgi:diguanylate cyclase (GGDEF)-like protein/PAS domain S-box-containing protein
MRLRPLLAQNKLVYLAAALGIFAVAALPYAGALILYHQAQVFEKREMVRLQEEESVEVARGILEAKIINCEKDISFLVEHAEDAVQLFPDRLSSHLTELFRDFARVHQKYGQVRMLDPSGREAIRVNLVDGEPQTVPAHELQDKSSQPYYEETLELEEGEVYVSDLDLNIENGRLERPFRPTLRFASPVFGEGNELRGIVVLNYNASRILAQVNLIEENSPNEPDFLLVNREGHFLLGAQSDSEWGFALEERADQTFEKYYGSAWQSVRKADDGHLLYEEGLLVFAPLFEPRAAGKEPIIAEAAAIGGSALRTDDDQPYSEDSWLLVSHVSEADFDMLLDPLHRRFLVFLMSGAIALAAASAGLSYALFRSHKAAVHIRKSEQYLREVLDAMGSGVLVVDRETSRIADANAVAAHMLGYAEDELIGLDCRSLFIHCCRSTDGSDEGVMQSEDAALRRDGTSVPVYRLSLPIVRDGREFALLNFVDFTEHQEMVRDLAAKANTDFLTGIPNRRRFLEIASAEFRRGLRYGNAFSVLMLDIDHFKKLNDRYGHDFGDEALKQFCLVVQEHLRENDVFARMGGEEFAVAAPQTDLEGAVVLAERLREAVEKDFMNADDGSEVDYTVSVGVAQMDEADSELDDILRRADLALYQAKENGRNQVQKALADAPGSPGKAIPPDQSSF